MLSSSSLGKAALGGDGGAQLGGVKTSDFMKATAGSRGAADEDPLAAAADKGRRRRRETYGSPANSANTPPPSMEVPAGSSFEQVGGRMTDGVCRCVC